MIRAGAMQPPAAGLALLRQSRLLRTLAFTLLALAIFAALLAAFGGNPITAYADILKDAFGSRYGFSEVIVKMIPLLLTAIAVAVPARVGLINVGGEGQLFMGAWFATIGALYFHALPVGLLLPIMVILGFIGGGLWAVVPGFFRARGWMSEVISTLLLNYVAPLLVIFTLYGIWRDPASSNYPQTVPFVDAARLPTFGDTRVHYGIVFGVVALAVFFLVLRRTRWGFEMRAMGGNPEAARRSGIPTSWYIVVTMLIGGGIAGMAGMAQASAIDGLLRPGVSPGYGYTGFLVSWLAGHNPILLLPMAFLLAVISAGGYTLQISHGLPSAGVNTLMALILFVVLAQRQRKAQTA